MRSTLSLGALVVGVAAAVALPGVAGAEQRGKGNHRATTFSGRCDFSGPVSFRPALTNALQALTQSASGSGACTGRYVDARGRTHKLANAPVSYAATSQAPAASCLFGTAKGRGVLTFPFGELRFELSETRPFLALLSLSGAKSGSATGIAAPSGSENPVAAVQRCAGAGISEINIDIHVVTTPAISG